MHLHNIEKLINKLKECNSDWIYSDKQIELMEDIREVNPYILAKSIAKKHIEKKNKPTVDQIEEIAKKLDLFDEDKEDVCGKCRNGYISIFNHKMWWFDEDTNMYRSHYGDWTPEKVSNIFMLPKMEILCDCRNPKRSRTMKIHSYLKWLSQFDYKATEFYQICYIQLYLFYSQVLEGSLSLDEFSPFAFWGMSNIDSPTLLLYDDIKDQHIKKLFREGIIDVIKPEIKDRKLKEFPIKKEIL